MNFLLSFLMSFPAVVIIAMGFVAVIITEATAVASGVVIIVVFVVMVRVSFAMMRHD